jgi:hypothetical protein
MASCSCLAAASRRSMGTMRNLCLEKPLIFPADGPDYRLTEDADRPAFWRKTR